MSRIILDVPRLENAMEWADREFQHSDEVDNMEVLNFKLSMLVSSLPWVNGQMVQAKRELLVAKEKAYREYIEKEQNGLTASIIKDYIASKLSEQQYAYDLAERLSRTFFHIAEWTRSQLSALKEEMKINNYSQNVM